MSVAPPTRSSRGLFLGRVLANEPICSEHWRFVIEVEGFPAAAPGQFLQILCAEPSDSGWIGGAYIRRPFSIGGLRRRGLRCELDVLHRAIGVGTRWLSQLSPGDALSVLGPLGQPFPLVDDRPVAYLVGGGIGLPPLIWLAEALRDAGKQSVAFCGARSADLVPLTRLPQTAVSSDAATLSFREFSDFNTPVLLSTDDGSLGAAGRIPDILARYLDQHADEARSAVVYTCGPDPMMRATAEVCRARDVSCFVCLERMMACGMGTCQSCVVPVRDESADDYWRYRLCCTDGPVFDGDVVLWGR